MAESQEPVRIAVNVMRARLTVLGFNLAVIAFQINELSRAPGATRLPNLSDSVHIEADAILFMAFALSMIAIIAYIASSAYDREGTCTPWLLVAGDLLMYLGLAHTIAGFFGPYIRALDAVALKVPDQAVAYATVRTAMLVAGGGAWFLATYFGPTACPLALPMQACRKPNACGRLPRRLVGAFGGQHVRRAITGRGLGQRSRITARPADRARPASALVTTRVAMSVRERESVRSLRSGRRVAPGAREELVDLECDDSEVETEHGQARASR